MSEPECDGSGWIERNSISCAGCVACDTTRRDAWYEARNRQAAGSSVPEAARAAAMMEHSFVQRPGISYCGQCGNHRGSHPDSERPARWREAVDRYFAPAGMALADEEIALAVAAAVAEERATTGRAWNEGFAVGIAYHDAGRMRPGKAEPTNPYAVRAALASPGEGE